jgi:hypothetical protein
MQQQLPPNNENAFDQVFDGYLTEQEYAHQRGVTIRTCQRDRALRQAPPHVIIGSKVYYRVEAVRAWLLKNERQIDRHPSAPRAGRQL